MIETFSTAAMTASTLPGKWGNSQVDLRESFRKAREYMEQRAKSRNEGGFDHIVATQEAVDYLKSKIDQLHGPAGPWNPLEFYGAPITVAEGIGLSREAFNLANKGVPVLMMEMKDGELQANLLRLPPVGTRW